MNRKSKIEHAARLLQNYDGIPVVSDKDVVREVKRLIRLEAFLDVAEEEDQKKYRLLGVKDRNGVRTLAFEKYRG